ncbi:MAG: hypothetical protein SFX72_15475 [Isosphaeraceae bacterium]|nr:hypothetical protein [Isosphaeraceae bacterium]
MNPEPPPRRPTADDFLRLGPRIRFLPIVHGSGDFAIRVREALLEGDHDCVAVPLPPSFQDEVEAAVEQLPRISVVVRPDVGPAIGEDSEEDDDEPDGFSYVPIDPCQGVIAAIRWAIGERVAREFIDLETRRFEANTAVFPDAYALKKVSAAGFAAAVLPTLAPPAPGLHSDRIAWMAARLRDLETRYRSILAVVSLQDWPWIRAAYLDRVEPPEPDLVYAPATTHAVDSRSLIFLLGELPFITGLYERGRIELTADDNLSVDGVKEMILAARERLVLDRPKIAARITPQLLSVYFRYVRNLSLIDHRLTPDLYTLAIAARQTAGDEFALAVAETARSYPHADPEPEDDELDDSESPPALRMSIDRADVPGAGPSPMVTRLPGARIRWRTFELRPKPPERERKLWKQRWNPHGICSWPPEDDKIESFHRHVRDQATAMLGSDLARTEKFSASVMDGIDIRETLRNWHTGDLYVKIIPPSRGAIEVVVFLFESPADPDVYTHRATWYAEHAEESTLAFYATDPMANLVGPGIAQAEYGGAMFLYPPRPIPEVWIDPRLRQSRGLDERLLSAACLHSRERHVAVVSARPPSLRFKQIARRHGRKLLHLPLGRFGASMIERLRRFHILNGKQVRSYAADFIRDV